MAAVHAFDATPLGLQVDTDADAAVRQSLRRTGLVLLGEGHGIAQTPVLVGELIAWFGLGGIALEWHEDLGRGWTAGSRTVCWSTLFGDPTSPGRSGAAMAGSPRAIWLRCAGGPPPGC